MALRGSKIENFDDISLVACSQRLPICVSSTSFQKSSIGWPQQPLTEKLLKYFIILPSKNIFAMQQNKAQFKNYHQIQNQKRKKEKEKIE